MQPDELTTKCPECGQDVISLWVPGGGCISTESYVLIADWVYHSDCWDDCVLRYERDTRMREITVSTMNGERDAETEGQGIPESGSAESPTSREESR